MKHISDSYGERCRFEAFCKTVLCNEVKTYLRDLCRQRKRETQFSALSQYEMDKLCTVDEYPSDSVVFTAFGCDLHIQNELVADAFASLPEREKSILILNCALELTDGEIGGIAGISLLLYRFAICLRKADYPPCFFTAFHNIFYHKTPPNALRIRRCFGFNLFVSSESNRLCLLPYWCPPKREAFSFIRFLHHFSTPIASRIVFS